MKNAQLYPYKKNLYHNTQKKNIAVELGCNDVG